MYRVYVDNVGLVLETGSRRRAKGCAKDYYERALVGNAGRADPHSFVMACGIHGDDDIVAEYGEPDADPRDITEGGYQIA